MIQSKLDYCNSLFYSTSFNTIIKHSYFLVNTPVYPGTLLQEQLFHFKAVDHQNLSKHCTGFVLLMELNLTCSYKSLFSCFLVSQSDLLDINLRFQLFCSWYLSSHSKPLYFFDQWSFLGRRCYSIAISHRFVCRLSATLCIVAKRCKIGL